jgi:hypothetical protein
LIPGCQPSYIPSILPFFFKYPFQLLVSEMSGDEAQSQLRVPQTRTESAAGAIHLSVSAPTSRNSSPITPELMQERETMLRQAILSIQSNNSLTALEKAKEIQLLMTSNWKGSKAALPGGHSAGASPKQVLGDGKMSSSPIPVMESNVRNYHVTLH